MKRFMTLMVLTPSLLAYSAANAERHTISLGYAQSKTNVSKKLDNPFTTGLSSSSQFTDGLNDLTGINFKYRFEFTPQVGIIASYTYSHSENDLNINGINLASAELDYNSFMAGPVFRLNDHISAYAMLGLAYSEFDVDHGNYSRRNYYKDDAGLATGVGLQFNPIPNMAIDLSYEHANMDELKFNTWVIGAGYRF